MEARERTEVAVAGVGPVTVVATDAELIPDHETLTGKLVLDVGCGTGAMVRWLEEQGAHGLGFDTGVMVDKARKASPGMADRFVEATAVSLPVEDESADVVLFLASLHHVPEPQMFTALAEAARVLKDGGSVVVIEPVAADGAYSTLANLVEDETSPLAAAVHAIGRHREVGLDLVAVRYLAMRRTLADFRRQVEVFVEDEARRRDCLRRAETVTRRLASRSDVPVSDYVYLSVCRRTLLRKDGA